MFPVTVEIDGTVGELAPVVWPPENALSAGKSKTPLPL